MRLTRHARDPMTEMGVQWAEVVAVLRDPDVTYPSSPGHGPGRLISLQGRLAVVHDDNGLVITVLWRGQPTSDRTSGPPRAA